jgi:putative transposase
LNALKREQFPWMLDVTKNAPQMAIIQLGQAFQNFFAGRARYPQFRKKGVHDRFTLTNDQFAIDASRIRIPHLGWVRMREPLRFVGKIMSATVSRVADKWFVSLAVDTQDDSPVPNAENQGAVGVDVGVAALATLSTGESIAGPKPHKALMSRLQRLSRSLSRKGNGSENRKKAKSKLSKLHARIASGQVVVADRFFASSKTCSACAHTLDRLPLAVREWTCPECGVFHDRDVNAAINLKHLAVSSTVSACGEEGAGRRRKTAAKPASVKQEVSVEPV